MVSKIVRSDLKVPGGNQKLAFLLDIVFSKEECEELIQISEEKGYEKALLNFGGGKQILQHLRGNPKIRQMYN